MSSLFLWFMYFTLDNNQLITYYLPVSFKIGNEQLEVWIPLQAEVVISKVGKLTNVKKG